MIHSTGTTEFKRIREKLKGFAFWNGNAEKGIVQEKSDEEDEGPYGFDLEWMWDISVAIKARPLRTRLQGLQLPKVPVQAPSPRSSAVVIPVRAGARIGPKVALPLFGLPFFYSCAVKLIYSR
ncbi:Hypothetical predicted protein [Olea europaea subsp. europaea]|uniref:Uncharacterized protein n=1 Tax=Olea europaea subsp. europaea TaxID=158383 RepID=A0A8S0PX62_OLEEU|nr:Hypothetical predicted protein [Olea europaea subsp. europaea]